MCTTVCGLGTDNSSRIYSFEVQLGTDSGSNTNGDIYFRIFGTNNNWSDWFSRNSFTAAGATYQWDQEIQPSVGDVKKVIVLSQQTDGFTLNTITIDHSNSYTISDVSYGADIDCYTTANNACSYIIVFFNGTDYVDRTRTYASGGCDLSGSVFFVFLCFGFVFCYSSDVFDQSASNVTETQNRWFLYRENLH